MTFLPFELRWWCATGQSHVLRVDAQGTPTLESDTAPAAPPRPSVGRRGVRWSDHDEAVLLEGFDAGVPLATLATDLGRSRGSVAARLVKLGRLSEEEAGLRFPVVRPPPPAE